MEWLNKVFDTVKGWFVKERNLVDHWFETDERIRFIIAAGGNMAFRYLLFVLLGLIFTTLHYQMILLLMWLISSVTAFYSYKILVFETEGNHLKEYLKSVLVWTMSYFINAGFLAFLVGYMGVNVYVAQAAAIVFLFVLNYLLFKHFAFRQKNEMTAMEKFCSLFDICGK